MRFWGNTVSNMMNGMCGIEAHFQGTLHVVLHRTQGCTSLARGYVEKGLRPIGVASLRPEGPVSS